MSGSISFPPRLNDESKDNYLAFILYCAMGPANRSVLGAYELYCREQEDNGDTKSRSPASKHWLRWSSRFNWVERSLEYDRLWSETIAEEFREEIKNKVTKKVFAQYEAFENVFKSLNAACIVITEKTVKIARLPIDEGDVDRVDKNGKPIEILRDRQGNPIYMKQRKEAIGMLKDISTTLNNVSNLASRVQSNWAELNGLTELKERLDSLDV